MALPPISVQLSKFEQLEILRGEIELREGELKHVDKQIKDCMFELERQRFLQGIHAVFQQLPPPEHAATLPQLNANRQVLADAIEAMLAMQKQLEAETSGQAAPPSRNPGLRPGPAAAQPAGGAGAPRRAKFDSFDDFRASKT
jgi:hypothetical protein